MAVTTDKYELPLMVEEDSNILANKLGIKRGRIHSAIYNNESGKIKGVKIVKVEK